MRDCLKCKAKGDKIVPVSDVKGKMLFDQRSAARAKLEETKNCEETYHADKVAEVEKAVEAKNVLESGVRIKKTRKITWKVAFYTIAGMVIFVTIGIISAPTTTT